MVSLLYARPINFRLIQVGLVAGVIREAEALILESYIPDQGFIFSNGSEADYITFNAGAIARVRAAEQKTTLVVD